MDFSRAAIDDAAARIRPHVRETPALLAPADTFGLGFPLALKLEQMQVTGSFKPRGAFNRILSNAVPAAGVIAASGGNHGIATAYAARRLGHRAEIFVPLVAAPAKVARLRDYGAIVHQTGERYADALAACEARRAETGALDVHAYDQAETIVGQGTVGREIERQMPDVTTLLVAVGGGGLIGGIAAWFAGRVRVIGVEPATSCCLHAALAAGRPVDVAVSGLAADSLGARSAGALMFGIARRHVERVVLVSDAAIRAAQQALWRELRQVAEPGGAAALAAALSGAYVPDPAERLGVLICGANTDPASVA